MRRAAASSLRRRRFGSEHRRVASLAARATRARAGRLRGAVALVVRAPARVLAGSIWDYFEVRVADAASRRCWSTSACPGRAGSRARRSTTRSQVLRAMPTPRTPPGIRRSCSSNERDAARAAQRRDRVARAAPARRRARRARCAALGVAARRPRRRLPAEHAATAIVASSPARARRDLVDVLARHGSGRGARPLPPDRAEGADRLRRLPLRRRRARPARAVAALLDELPSVRDSSLVRYLEPTAERRRALAGAAAAACHDFDAVDASPASATFAPRGCRSTIRSGSSTRAARPGCRRRSCTATAASCSRR